MYGKKKGQLTLQKVYQVLFNDPLDVTAQPGMSSNLQVGAGAQPIIELADVPISDLDKPLFKPFKITFTYSVSLIDQMRLLKGFNLVSLMQTNPNGYIQFTWDTGHFRKIVVKGFITHVTQSMMGQEQTIEMLAHPDMADEDLINLCS